MSRYQSESAGPALRGFRLQMLYTLARLTEPRATLQATLFWPEGVEDLAVFDAETLRDRLKRQVDGIRDAAIEKPGLRAALDLLALVSFASALGARLDIASLREHFPGVDLGRIVERLEMPPMVRHLEGWQPRTWAAIGGVLRALLWWGVRRYVDRLSGLVAEIMSTIGKAWLFTLDLDLVELNPDGTVIWRQFDFISDQRKALLQSFLHRQPPKASALESARRWLAGLATPPTPPETHGDWTAVSELSYWTGRWSIDAPVAGWLRAIDLTPVLAQLPLQQLSDLLLGPPEMAAAREFSLVTGRFKILTKHLSAIIGLAKTGDADCRVILRVSRPPSGRMVRHRPGPDRWHRDTRLQIQRAER